ncbi:VOC family protein, partial [Jatrophihabitans endophyticus]|uniref:VOC family protein n=1 Tax=Jatrophihabitans endophyticus TaxID=1206085 RepID=UPI0026EF2DBF
LSLERVPDVRVTADVVDLVVATKVDGIWVTPPDLDTARAISDLARAHGLVADPGGVTQLELALDTARDSVIAPFWAALLTGNADNTINTEVFDPTRRVPVVWFQRSAPSTEVPDQRWHFDVWLAPEVADERIAAAVAAGGTVVFDGEAPAFTVLADADGNRVCICTSLDRG